MTPADILRRAAQAFREGELTWGREWFAQTDDNRCRCAGGAVAFAINPRTDDADPMWGPASDRALGTSAMELLADYLVRELGATRCVYIYTDTRELDVIETVGGWNDEQEDVADVIAALEGAAAWGEGRAAA